MELLTRLVFIDTSAYEQKKFQFGHFALARLEKLVTEKKIHLLITDVVHCEINNHLKKFANEAVTELKKAQKSFAFLRAADNATGGGLFAEVSSEAVLDEITTKFRALMDNGLTEHISVSRVDPSLIFEAYFSGAPPFHRESKKSEFPDAFTLAAVDAIARERFHKVYIVSGDADMKAVAEGNDNCIYLENVDTLLNLVNRNDEELREMSAFADTVFERIKLNIMSLAKAKLYEAEFLSDSSMYGEHELTDVDITNIEIVEMQLINVYNEGATYDVTFGVTVQASYEFTDYSVANWDREDQQYNGVVESNEVFIHQEQYVATLELGFADSLKVNAEIIDLAFDDAIFQLDFDNVSLVNPPDGSNNNPDNNGLG